MCWTVVCCKKIPLSIVMWRVQLENENMFFLHQAKHPPTTCLVVFFGKILLQIRSVHIFLRCLMDGAKPWKIAVVLLRYVTLKNGHRNLALKSSAVHRKNPFCRFFLFCVRTFLAGSARAGTERKKGKGVNFFPLKKWKEGLKNTLRFLQNCICFCAPLGWPQPRTRFCFDVVVRPATGLLFVFELFWKNFLSCALCRGELHIAASTSQIKGFFFFHFLQ